MSDEPAFGVASNPKQVGKSSLHNINLVEGTHNTTVNELQVVNLRRNDQRDKSSLKRSDDGTRRTYGKIETSFR